MGTGEWFDAKTLEVASGATSNYAIPAGMQVKWVRFVAQTAGLLTTHFDQY